MSAPDPDFAVETAIQAACALTGDTPEEVVRGDIGIRARHYAFEALMLVFPAEDPTGLAQRLKYADPKTALRQIAGSRRASWWSEVTVDEIVGAIVADQYGEQAA